MRARHSMLRLELGSTRLVPWPKRLKEYGHTHTHYPVLISLIMLLDPLNYSSIRHDMKGIHGAGEVWAQILFNVYSSLRKSNVAPHNLYWDDGVASGRQGVNDIMARLLIDGMKLQPCWPTFIDARNAILAVDQIRFQGKYRCILWNGFASRGLGVDALPGGMDSFDQPSDCSG